MKVPWLTKNKIAERASALIQYFQSLAGHEIKPSIPVEEIVERAFGCWWRWTRNKMDWDSL